MTLNPTNFITPAEAIAKGDTRTLEELQEIARAPAGQCENCEEEAWKYGGAGMCFPCATGETDSSADYELVESHDQE